MRGLKTQASAQLFASGHAFVQNLRRGHYELAVAVPPKKRLVRAFAERPPCSDGSGVQQPHDSPPQRNSALVATPGLPPEDRTRALDLLLTDE